MLSRFKRHFMVEYERIKMIAYASVIDFINDDCYTKASTLTFYTVQSIVPFLAFLFGIAKGFGFDAYLENLIESTFLEQREVATYSIQLAQSMLKHTEEGAVIGFGLALLIWSLVNLLSYIEIVLNQIWKIKEVRTFFRKLNDYVAILIIGPLFLIVSSSLTVFLKTSIATWDNNEYLDTISLYIMPIFTIVPWVLSWMLFFLLYFFMPNAKLRVWPRIIAAIVAGSAFQLWQIFYIAFQIRIFNYNVIYGSLAVLPLLLIWMQVSWLIALAGAELAANIENLIFYDEEQIGGQENISRRQLGLLILLLCLRSFYQNERPVTEFQIAKALRIPLNITKKMLDILTNGEILAPVELKNGTTGYAPFSDPGNLTIKQVCDVIEQSNNFEISIPASDELNKLLDLLEKMDEAEVKSEANLRIDKLFFEIKGENESGLPAGGPILELPNENNPT